MTQQDPDDWVELPWQPGQRPMWVSQAQLAAILREPPSPFPLGHPLFAGEVHRWQDVLIKEHKSVSATYPTGMPWLLPDGRPPFIDRPRWLPIPPMLRNRREVRFACMAMGMPGRFPPRPWPFGGDPTR